MTHKIKIREFAERNPFVEIDGVRCDVYIDRHDNLRIKKSEFGAPLADRLPDLIGKRATLRRDDRIPAHLLTFDQILDAIKNAEIFS